jgi:hypothetical protein
MARLFKTGITSEGVLTSNGLTLSSTTSPIILNAAAGTSGQVLTSAGAGATPTWTSVSGTGTVTSITAGTNGLTGGTITTSGTIDIDTAKVPRLTTNTNTFQASSGATTLAVRVGPTQGTTNLMEWRSSDGASVTGSVRYDGNVINFGGVEASYYMTATAGTTSNVPMTVYGQASHTASLQEWWKLGEGSPRAVINQYGDLYLPGSAIQIGTSYLTAKISVAPGAAEHGLVIRGASGQSANLQEWQNNTPTTVASVSPSGVITGSTFSGSGASLTSIPAGELTGTVADARIASALTGKTYNGLAVTSTTGTLTISSGKTVTVNRTLTLTGTDSTTMTFPSTNATIARTDAAQTFTGVQSMTSPAITTSITSPSSTFNIATSSGTINIGSTSPGSFVDMGNDLVVSNNLAVDQAATFGGGFGSTGVSISAAGQIDANGSITAEGNITVGTTLLNGALTRAFLTGGGTTGANFNNNGQLVRVSSSERYKEDIEDAEYVYEDILSLSPKTFRLKEEVESNPDARVYAGFIAEDVDKLDSLKVFVAYAKTPDGDLIPDSLYYAEMVSALVSALKHQDSRIKALEAQVQALSE